VFVLCLVGCSSDPTLSPAVAEQALSNHEHCGGALANQTISTFPKTVVGHAPYGNGNCANAFLVDVNPPLNAVVNVQIAWSAGLPANQTDCENATVWNYTFGPLTGVAGAPGGGDTIIHGIWSNGACSIQAINSMQCGVGGAPTRFGISARENNVMKDVSLTATTLGNCPPH
jgi:hypothetical protein